MLREMVIELPEKSASPATLGETDVVEQFVYDDAIVRKFLTATYIWGVVAMSVGLWVAITLILPPFREWLRFHGASGLSNAVNFVIGIPYFNFGRIRPLHTNAAIFAFAGNALFTAIYYSTQRLCRARMWSDRLSKLHFWGWQLIIVSAALTLPFGYTKGKEYAELEWPIDIAIAVVWVGFFAVNFFMTLIKRRERHLYVALWFYIASIVTVTILHVFNNLVVPAGLFKSYSVYAGVQDAFMQWWYGHNAVAFFLTTPFLGLMYYFLPKAAERPIFSYRLSIVHFWSLVFIYIWAGPHHLHYTALPDWASSLGMIFSLMLWMPSWGGMINGLLTLRGAWNKVASDPVLKFFVVGITFYGMATFEGPLLAIKSVNALSHYTDWTIAHVHSGTLGWNGFMTFGMMYWLLPRLFQTKLYSQKLANVHFWLGTVGIVLYIIPIYVAGITEGLMWRAVTDTGQLQYPDFIETVRAVVPMWSLRAVGGSIYLASVLVGGVNFYKTWKSRPRVYAEVVQYAPPLSKTYNNDPLPPKSQLGHVADVGRSLELFSSFYWHRRWERLPVRLTMFVIAAVAIASLLEAVPEFLIRANIPTISTVKPYTPLELAGRDLYLREGCFNCHSQMIRPILSETKRYGEYSKAGEFVYDHPFQWGSRRIGPDLAREGGRQSNLWHVLHFRAPGQITPGSVMPQFTYLLADKLDFDSIPVRVRAMMALGVPYTTEEHEHAAELAHAQAAAILKSVESQNGGPFVVVASPTLDSNRKTIVDSANVLKEDSEVIALIAYLQRMGTDLFAQPKQ